jgi:hypothetical protein
MCLLEARHVQKKALSFSCKIRAFWYALFLFVSLSHLLSEKSFVLNLFHGITAHTVTGQASGQRHASSIYIFIDFIR